MAKARLITTNLLRLLDRIHQPVYILQPDYVVAYANQACLDWIGVESTELNHAVCRYTSEELEHPVENKLRGLAVSPDWTEMPSATTLEFKIFADQDGTREFRRGQGTCLTDSDGVTALLVIASQNPQTELHEEGTSGPTSNHEWVARLTAQHNRRFQYPSLLSLDSVTQAMRQRIDVAIQSGANVVISGGPGTGKEHLARTIDRERRPDSPPPVPIYGSFADQDLVQQHFKELSSGSKQGDPLAACLLLLDVDKLNHNAQSELLGFLQLPHVRFQVIATSERNLSELSKDVFSQELIAVLSTLTIELRPLCERAGDIPILAQAIIEELNIDRPKQLAGFSPAAMQLLEEFNWPHNIDQLKRELVVAAEQAKGNKIVLEDLPASLRQASRALEIGQHEEETIVLDEYLGQIEAELIARAMQQAKGNKSKAAKLLGISRPKLLRRLQLFESLKDEEDDSQFVDSSAFTEAEDDDAGANHD